MLMPYIFMYTRHPKSEMNNLQPDETHNPLMENMYQWPGARSSNSDPAVPSLDPTVLNPEAPKAQGTETRAEAEATSQ